VPAQFASSYPADDVTLDDLASELADYAARGFRYVKVAAGKLEEDSTRLREARTTEPTTQLIHEHSASRDVTDVLPVVRSWEDLELDSLEDPFPSDLSTLMAKPRRAARIPMKLGEDCVGRWAFGDLLRSGLADIVRVETTTMGDIRGRRVPRCVGAGRRPPRRDHRPSIGCRHPCPLALDRRTPVRPVRRRYVGRSERRRVASRSPQWRVLAGVPARRARLREQGTRPALDALRIRGAQARGIGLPFSPSKRDMSGERHPERCAEARMARTPIKMPKLGYDMETGTIGGWLKRVGDEIARGDVIAEIETDKVMVEMEATASGTLAEIVHDSGDEVAVGEPIAWLEDGYKSTPTDD